MSWRKVVLAGAIFVGGFGLVLVKDDQQQLTRADRVVMFVATSVSAILFLREVAKL